LRMMKCYNSRTRKHLVVYLAAREIEGKYNGTKEKKGFDVLPEFFWI